MPLTEEQLKDLDRMAELLFAVPNGPQSREYIDLCVKNVNWMTELSPEVDAAVAAAREKYKPKE